MSNEIPSFSEVAMWSVVSLTVMLTTLLTAKAQMLQPVAYKAPASVTVQSPVLQSDDHEVVHLQSTSNPQL